MAEQEWKDGVEDSTVPWERLGEAAETPTATVVPCGDQIPPARVSILAAGAQRKPGGGEELFKHAS